MDHIQTAPQVIAHRGASAAAPEHTHEAYGLAVAQGADVIELDVRATRDGELVVLHDRTLMRTAGDARPVASVTSAELDLLPFRPLPLEDVLARHGASARMLIELKDPRPEWEGLVATAVQRHGIEDRVTLQSFDLAALRRLRLRAPHLPLSSLHRRRPASRTLDAVARFAGCVGVWHPRVDAGMVAAAHARGIRVNAWTVNTPAALARVLAAGVDGVISDLPDMVGAAVSAPLAAQAA